MSAQLKRIKAVAIGSSTGGPKALKELVPQLTSFLNIPIFIVQHMPPNYTKTLAAHLDESCKYDVEEAKMNQRVEKNKVYIAPGGKHMCLKQRGENVVLKINENPPENSCRPSVDVLFRSIPSCYSENVLAIILTGMGKDGTKGLNSIVEAGGHVIAQDSESSVVWGMPGNAVRAGVVDKVLPLNKIAEEVRYIVESSL